MGCLKLLYQETDTPLEEKQDFSWVVHSKKGANVHFFALDEYPYGFQSQERDDELKGEGNSWNFKYRMHDPRLGRFFAVDPLIRNYPNLTPYQFSGNSTIRFIELEGKEYYYPGQYQGYKLFDANQDRRVSDEEKDAGYKALAIYGAAGVTVATFGVAAEYFGPAVIAEWGTFSAAPGAYTYVALSNPQTSEFLVETVGSFYMSDYPGKIGVDDFQYFGRRTWQQSEALIGDLLESSGRAVVKQAEYRLAPFLYRDAIVAQQSFKKNAVTGIVEAVPYGTKGSARPEYYDFANKISYEVKNYSVSNNKSALIKNIADQANYRKYNLPEGTQQRILIDIKGQAIDKKTRDEITNSINSKLEKGVNLSIEFID